MTMEQEQQRRRGGGDDDERNDRRPTGGTADADGAPPRPRPPPTSTSLHRALPSDPNLAARVQSVPDSAAEEVKRILLAEVEREDENGETSALVREFLSSPNADATINQFLRAVGGKDARAAVARLLSTLKWRKEANPGERSCEECKKVRFLFSFFFLFSGRDVE